MKNNFLKENAVSYQYFYPQFLSLFLPFYCSFFLGQVAPNSLSLSLCGGCKRKIFSTNIISMIKWKKCVAFIALEGNKNAKYFCVWIFIWTPLYSCLHMKIQKYIRQWSMLKVWLYGHRNCADPELLFFTELLWILQLFQICKIIQVKVIFG